MNDTYTLREEGDRLLFRTVLYRTGSGSALNSLVYNRELSALLLSIALTGGIFAAFLRALEPVFLRFVFSGVVFGIVYWVLRNVIFRERITELLLERLTGTVKISSTGLWGRSLTRILRLGEIRFLDVEEQPALDESDVSEIIKWHKMAEPGVHATPLPVVRLHLVLADGSRLLVYTDITLDRVLDVRRRLGHALGLATSSDQTGSSGQ